MTCESLIAIAALLAILLCAAGAHTPRVRRSPNYWRARLPLPVSRRWAPALEACMREARGLDREGVAIGEKFAAIDREAAVAMFLQNRVNAELPLLGDYDEAALNDFQPRVICHAALAKKFRAEFQRHQQKPKACNATATAFDHDCALGFATGDLAAVKAELGIK